MRVFLKEIPDSGMVVEVPTDDRRWVECIADLAETDGDVAVAARVELHKGAGQLEIRGTLSGTVPVLCSRCAEDVQCPVNTEFFSNYLVSGPGAEELELRPDEMDASILESDHVELFEALREQVLLALPATPLCKEDCAGLCPSCGKNQNLTPCNCEPAVASSPFAALAGMVSARAED